MFCFHQRRMYLLVFLLYFFIFCKADSQSIDVGIKYSYGNQYFTRQSDNLKTPKYGTHRIMLAAEYTPYFSKLYVCSGLEYETYTLGTSLKIPLTIKFVPGKRISPFFEGGGFYTIILKEKTEDLMLVNDAGAKAGAGLRVRAGKKLICEIGYSYRFGLTTALEEEVLLPLHQVAIEEYRRKSGSFEISLKYHF